LEQFWGFPFLAVGCLLTTADFNGDGYPDYLLCNVTTGQTVIWYLNDNVYIGSAFGLTGWRLIAP
jgi:hypothetical protein